MRLRGFVGLSKTAQKISITFGKTNHVLCTTLMMETTLTDTTPSPQHPLASTDPTPDPFHAQASESPEQAIEDLMARFREHFPGAEPWRFLPDEDLEDTWDALACLWALYTLSYESEPYESGGRSEVSIRLYDMLPFAVSALVETIKYDWIEDIWEAFGSLRFTYRSEEEGEFGVWEVNDISEEYTLAFSIPFDAEGRLVNVPRLVFKNEKGVLWRHDFSREIGLRLLAEVQDEVADLLAEEADARH